MNNNQIENHIKAAVTRMTPDNCESILAAPVIKDGCMMPAKTLSYPKRSNRLIYGLAAVAAALVLTLSGGALYYTNSAVASVIALDVNPSVEISANRNDRVVAATAANDDGKKILGDMNLKNTDIDVAMNAIIGSMVQNGYLSAEKNSILLTVSAKDESKSNELRYNAVSSINEALAQNNIPAHIYNQTLGAIDNTLKSASKAQGISYGKLSFAEKIAAVDPTITTEQLIGMSMDEIDKLLATNKLKKLVDVDLDDDDDDYCDYCGKPESDCRKTCNRSSGKRYCDDCGKLLAKCICVDDDIFDDIDDDLDDDDKSNNRDKDKNDNRPAHSNANTDNSNRYKDKFDDNDDYCDYCGKPESVCQNTCDRTGGERYCDDCGKLAAQCICKDKDKDKNNNKDKDKDDKYGDEDDDDDDDDSDDDDRKGNNKDKDKDKVKPDKGNKPSHDDDDRDDDGDDD